MEKTIKIRAHHLLCLQGYQGYGYSSTFAKHLADSIERIKKELDSLIEIVISGDIICDKCPNYLDGKCKKDADAYDRIRRMDLEVLNISGIEIGSIDTCASYFDTVNRCVQGKSQVVNICGNCQWSEKCLWYLSLDNS